eukprot:TRINITY_DN3052_c0_g1_i6.p4 TRINITY_DN3052_c0_g1~~TRINITY_DN3052_c0_g1_i6.p4  ORF type:complete len:139 (-),score=1.58 TRINITY_DN3052_c0_g1_i6:508-924(-)
MSKYVYSVKNMDKYDDVCVFCVFWYENLQVLCTQKQLMQWSLIMVFMKIKNINNKIKKKTEIGKERVKVVIIKKGGERQIAFFFRWVTFYIASWQYFSFVQFPFIYQKYIYTYKYKNNQYNIYSRLSLIRNPRAKKPF